MIGEAMKEDNIYNHLDHVKEYIDDPRISNEANAVIESVKLYSKIYNKIADELASASAGKAMDVEKSEVVGYIDKNDSNRYIKYDVKNRDFVVYNCRTGSTISLHKRSLHKYLNSVRSNFGSELPENQEIDEIDDDSQKLIDSFLKN